MRRDSEGKGKREGHVPPKQLKSNAMKKCIEGYTLDIVKKAGAKSTQVCKDKENGHSSKNQEL